MLCALVWHAKYNGEEEQGPASLPPCASPPAVPIVCTDVPYLLGSNLKSTCSDVSSTGAVCSTRPPPGASHMLGARLDRRPHYMPAYFVTTEHVDNIGTSEYPRRSTFPCAKCQNATTAGQRWQSASIHRSAFCPQNIKRDGQAEQ